MNSVARVVRRVVLYEGRDSQPWQDSQRLELLSALLAGGYAVSCVRPGGSLADLGHRQLVVLGQFGDQLPPLVAGRAGEIEVHVRDITGVAPQAVVQVVEAACGQTGGGTAAGWKPWFPVIDFSRCTHCMQCLSFCLFDVYGVTPGGQIQVQNQSNCKTDCPACARVCPQVAIVFPKYKAGPINGDEVNSDDLRREAMKVDISGLLGGDIYSLLRDRSAKARSRFSKERDDERALRERQRCLQKLQQGLSDLDVPPEVMASLPSPDQIQAKLREAQQRSLAARQPALDAPRD